MHILFTTDHYLPTVNGVVTHVCLLKEELEKRGHTVYIVSQTSKLQRHKNKGIFYLPSLPLPIRAKDPLTLPFNPLVKKKIMQLPIDIVHNHLFISGFFGMEIAKEKHIPFVTTYHTFIRQYADWIVPWARKVTHPTANWLAREYFGNNTAVIAPSRKAIYELQQARVRTPMYLMPNAIKLDVFEKSNDSLFRKTFKLDSKRPLVLITGTLEIGKNVDLAIQSIALLRKTIPDVCLAIVGDGKLRKKMEVCIKKYHLSKHVLITGFVDTKMVASANKAADVVLFTSDTDNFPTVLIEAVAAGKPIVAIKDRAIEDLVKDHQNGFVVRKDPYTITAALKTLLLDTSLCTNYGEESSRMANQFSIERYVDRLETLYLSLNTTK